jgi:hypothetical protein
MPPAAASWLTSISDKLRDKFPEHVNTTFRPPEAWISVVHAKANAVDSAVRGIINLIVDGVEDKSVAAAMKKTDRVSLLRDIIKLCNKGLEATCPAQAIIDQFALKAQELEDRRMVARTYDEILNHRTACIDFVSAFLITVRPLLAREE